MIPPVSAPAQPDDSGDNSPRRWFSAGVKAALSGPAWVVALSLVGVGGLAHDAGQPLGIALLSTLLVWASPAQLVYFTSVATHVPPVIMGTAICLIGFRFLPMCVALLPVMRRPGTSLGALLLASHLVSLTVWVESMWRLPKLDGAARLPFFLGFGAACIGLSTVATGAGFLLIERVPAPIAAGLLFLSPLYFLASLTRGAKLAIDWIAIGLGLALMPVATQLFGGSLDLMAVGLAGGGAAWGAHRARARKDAA